MKYIIVSNTKINNARKEKIIVAQYLKGLNDDVARVSYRP